MSDENKKFHEFFIETDRKDIFHNLDEFYNYLEDAKKINEYAYRRQLKSGTTSNVDIRDNDGKDKNVVMMGANNYLDFAADPDVVNSAKNALEKYGYGSGSVALLAGTFEIHKQLEEQIARFYEREKCCIFPTGYSTNVGTISALIESEDLILLDMYSHASIVDGTKLTNATVKYFKHNDMEHLEKQLKRIRDKFNGCLIVTDGVFSMDGDVCDLPKLLELKEKYNARLMIDEAHGVGIIGKTGRGTEEFFEKVGEVDIITGTLSKAPAGLGGYVVGSPGMVEKVRHFASSYVFSTSLPPSVIGGLQEVFHKMETDTSRMEALHKNIDHFAGRLRELGFNIGETITAIVPVIIGDEKIVMEMSKELAQNNVFASAVVFPAVSKTQSRLRISLMCSHTKEELDLVLGLLEKIGKEKGII